MPAGCVPQLSRDLLVHVAANRVNIVRYLLEAGANRTLVNAAGLTPRQLAEEKGYADVVALFEA